MEKITFRRNSLIALSLSGALALGACSSGETNKDPEPTQTTLDVQNPLYCRENLEGHDVTHQVDSEADCPSPGNNTDGWTIYEHDVERGECIATGPMDITFDDLTTSGNTCPPDPLP